MEISTQIRLSSDQIEAFHHADFVEDQVRDFQSLMGSLGDGVVVDMGGGCGFLARRLTDAGGHRARVIDMDAASVDECRSLGVEAELGDALAPCPRGDEVAVCFNLVLHHLVGANERETRKLQLRALEAWLDWVDAIFVNEYIYESFIPGASGRLIYEITSSRLLSFIGRQVGRVIKAFRANTFGVGVRFRSHEEWVVLFRDAGFRVVGETRGSNETISPPLRMLLIKAIRRDSYRLEPIKT